MLNSKQNHPPKQLPKLPNVNIEILFDHLSLTDSYCLPKTFIK